MYKNIYINVNYFDQIESALKARGVEYATLTEARERAHAFGGYAVRVYYAPGGCMISWKDLTIAPTQKKGGK